MEDTLYWHGYERVIFLISIQLSIKIQIEAINYLLIYQK